MSGDQTMANFNQVTLMGLALTNANTQATNDFPEWVPFLIVGGLVYLVFIRPRTKGQRRRKVVKEKQAMGGFREIMGRYFYSQLPPAVEDAYLLRLQKRAMREALEADRDEYEAVCPYCDEEIKAAAKKCKHCGEWL